MIDLQGLTARSVQLQQKTECNFLIYLTTLTFGHI